MNNIIERSICPVCNTKLSKSIFKRSFNEELVKDSIKIGYHGNADINLLEDVIFEIVKCNNCGLFYQKYVLDEHLLNELYNKWIDPKLAEKWNEDKKYLSKQQYSFILNFAQNQFTKDPSLIKVLDFGAGFGDSLMLAKEMGFDAYAFEYSEERIQFLEKKGIKVIDHKDDTQFDLIIVNQVLEHLTHPREVMKFLISKLAMKGLLYISVPNCPNLDKRINDTEKIKEVSKFQKVLLNANVVAFQHINYFNNFNLKLFLNSFDLKVISPFNQVMFKSSSIRYLILPFYNYYFRTSFFVKWKD